MVLKRIFDFIAALSLLIILMPILIATAIIIKLTSPGPALYWSDRIGLNSKIFSMPKFRSMKTNAPQVATHLLQNSIDYLTPIGRFIRKTSIDELPQLYSILKGDMSFVGPRPALFNQYDLIEKRKQCGVDKILPGITGLAQINGRDDLTNDLKVKFDLEYLEEMSIFLDFKILLKTVSRVFKGSGVAH